MKTNPNHCDEEFSRLSHEAFENIRFINRELLIAASADLPDEAATALDQAREHVLYALRFDSRLKHRPRLVEEMAILDFKTLRERGRSKFGPLFGALEVRSSAQNNRPQMPSKLNGRRNHKNYGCL